jgi:alpha-ribazole phosphatase
MDVVLIRHARPDVGPGICYGNLDLSLAVPMTPAPTAIVAALPVPQRIVTSPLLRAGDTAKALMRALTPAEPAIDVEPRLRELDFGDWEGKPWDVIPRAELDDWAGHLLEGRPHGGESAAQAMARVTAWADTLSGAQDRCIWVVGHAGPMRMLAAHWLRLPLDRTLGWELAFGASCLFRLGNTQPQLAWWNRGAA